MTKKLQSPKNTITKSTFKNDKKWQQMTTKLQSLKWQKLQEMTTKLQSPPQNYIKWQQNYKVHHKNDNEITKSTLKMKKKKTKCGVALCHWKNEVCNWLCNLGLFRVNLTVMHQGQMCNPNIYHTNPGEAVPSR